jgi:predicted nucleic acid-binding protein
LIPIICQPTSTDSQTWSSGLTPRFDLLIAAVARQHKLTLLTADQDFAPVKGLKIDDWL